MQIYIGDDQLDALATIKGRTYREHWIASAPAQRVISALQNQFAEVEATEAETEA
jgi:large subunit ribosomal protein L10